MLFKTSYIAEKENLIFPSLILYLMFKKILRLAELIYKNHTSEGRNKNKLGG